MRCKIIASNVWRLINGGIYENIFNVQELRWVSTQKYMYLTKILLNMWSNVKFINSNTRASNHKSGWGYTFLKLQIEVNRSKSIRAANLFTKV